MSGAWFQTWARATKLKASVPFPSQWIGSWMTPSESRTALKVPYSPFSIQLHRMPTATGDMAHGTSTRLRNMLRPTNDMLSTSAIAMPSASPPSTVTTA